MRVTTVSKSLMATLVAASLLVGGDAWAQRGEGRGRGDGGGEDGGGRSSSSRSDSGGSSRSFSRGDGGSSRSSSRGDSASSRSFSRGDSGSSRQYSRPSEGSSRSFSRGSDQGSSQARSYRSGGERSTFSPSTRGSTRTDQFSDRSGDSRNIARDRSSDGQRTLQGAQQYQARRPNEDQVRDFLQMREGGERQADSRSGQFQNRSRGDSDAARRAELARRSELGRDSDRDVNDRIRDGRDSDRSRDFARDRDSSRERDFANRDRDGREGDRDYQRWRDGARGRDGRDDDNRDWSGRWRDGDRFTSANRIRDDWRRRDRDDYPFYGRWWDDDDHWHGDHSNWWGRHAHRHNRPFYWWAWATAPRLTNWVHFGWNRPYYWDYGHGEYIYYDDGIVYVNGRWYAPGPVFYDRTVQIVERAPDLTAEAAAELEWMPLGVFAIAPDGAAQADVLVQLAVTQDGVLGGTAFDQKSDAAYPVEGAVEKETQRAVWSFTNDRDQRIVMETSIFNLTQPEATGLVHYGPNDFRTVSIVRLEQPEGSAAVSAGTGELPTP
jgi:hypothetical protein